MGGSSGVIRVSTIRFAAVVVFTVVGANHIIGAVVFHARGAFVTFGLEAGARLGTDADSVTKSVCCFSVNMNDTARSWTLI